MDPLHDLPVVDQIELGNTDIKFIDCFTVYNQFQVYKPDTEVVILDKIRYIYITPLAAYHNVVIAL